MPVSPLRPFIALAGLALGLLLATPANAQDTGEPAGPPATAQETVATVDQPAPPAPTTKATTPPVTIDREAVRQARLEIAEERVVTMQFWLGLLGLLIGIFATAITVFGIVIAIRVERAAIAAAAAAARKEIQDKREEIDGLHADVTKFHATARRESEKIARLASQYAEFPDQKIPSLEEQEEINSVEKSLARKRTDDLTRDELVVRIIAALQQKEWRKAIELASYLKLKFTDDRSTSFSLMAQAEAQVEIGQAEESVRSYDMLIERFGNSETPFMQERVAKALCNKGVRLAKLDRPKEALAALDMLFNRFADSDSTALQEEVARGLGNKGAALSRFGKQVDAIATCDALIGRFGDRSNPVLQKQVNRAFYNKACAYALLGDLDSVIATLLELKKRSTPISRKMIADDTDFDTIRDDPKFVAFLAEHGSDEESNGDAKD